MGGRERTKTGSIGWSAVLLSRSVDRPYTEMMTSIENVDNLILSIYLSVACPV